MPPKKALRPPPSSELHEPYERYLYGDLRHELSVRHIRIPRSGHCLNTRVGFIQLLRDWDEAQTQTPETPRRTSPRRTQNKNQTQMTSTRVIRARRGCRFRLINVLLSPDFNRRWNEMVTRGGKMEVNRLWLDVHAAFMAQNSVLDALHFQDALFVNVTPNVILGHSAARLLQMWIEIVAMYRNAVAQAKEAASHNDNVHSFFDFCAGRLDLLYLHMAMLLEPKLYEFVMGGKLSAAEPFSKSKTKTKTVAAVESVPATAAESKPGAAIKATAAKAKAATPVQAIAETIAPTPTSTKVAVTTPPNESKLSGLLTQNPEMKEPLSPAIAKSPATTKTAAVKANKSSIKPKAKQAKPAASPLKPAAQKKDHKAGGKGKAPATAASFAKETKPKAPASAATAKDTKPKAMVSVASAKETKPKASPSKQKQPASPAKPKVASKPVIKKSSGGDKPAHTTAHGKRPREEEDTSIVEVPTVSDIVPHSGNKRVHTTTTTISTALATRSTDMMLPPDEWDILESRLRKVNENIDRCHCGLSSVEGNVSDSYKQSLEADLRFYSAIKQRLQEQLLVVMQSGY
ncbi:hypothetical protein F442_04980 [Phytophthora nicotianae P10297]|uniref:Uncharacterized protein n=4 Tax=Phytophthora nicotianae TaxID=4792 RepID=V9FJY0_PHYNI|nr:hypothetical protein F443_04917 [Phytophthora nicotianae P1569]ETL98262.1 hypothetical protein L917_04633 [Phytophthora nicotianae]ETM51425.1 hypothetical protein L914_04735 [Phytophthora nicotianae]ETO80564.1 hypothetical protein F444_04960 [Phytophthora nicotianae P1976]ETP49508.1 hypothetical protein F442_04980 [Phytophthora nicotianae P10297]